MKKSFHNCHVQFRSSLPRFIGHLTRRQEAQDREGFLLNAILSEPKGYRRTLQSA